MTYQEFVQSKTHLSGMFGFEPIDLPSRLFDFQQHVATWLIKKGRAACFADTGMGKTGLELIIASNIVQKTNRPVLILTPLAVAFQFLREAELLGISDIEYSREGKYSKKIVVTNYERLHYFNPNDFEGLILDESSILKNFAGKVKNQITAFIKQIRYRFLFTATPSPNDHIELGTSAEALGYMGYTDMLGRFFANNENNIRPQDIGNKFYLKPHAREDFFKWVASWSISLRKPSDVGPFDDSRYKLPELITRHHSVRSDANWFAPNGQLSMFGNIARRNTEVRDEQKETITPRCEKAYALASAQPCSVYWVNFNAEGDLLAQIDPDARQLTGGMSLEQKEELLIAFADGQLKKLITKSKMTGFGLNWQHCNHTVFFPTFSFEQYYQSVKRFHRFGQVRPVTCELVYSDGQKRVIDTLDIKIARNLELYGQLIASTNTEFTPALRQFNQSIQLPSFLKTA